MKKTLLAVAALTALTACNQGPAHVVIEAGPMVVYHAEARDSSSAGSKYKQKYEYWVTDDSKNGWRLLSDKKFNVGDKIEVALTEDSK